MSGISFLCEVAESSARRKNECADCSSDENYKMEIVRCPCIGLPYSYPKSKNQEGKNREDCILYQNKKYRQLKF